MENEVALQRTLNTIQHGDCVAGMDRLPAGCMDLAFADPPFNIGYEYDVYDDRKEREHYLDWSRDWISAVHRVLKPSGTFWLAIGDEYAAELKVLSQEIGFHCRSWVIWYYTFGVNCKRNSAARTCIYFTSRRIRRNSRFAPANWKTASRQLDNWSTTIIGRIPTVDCRTTPGSCVRKTWLTVLPLGKTAGTSPAWRGRSKNAKDSTVAKCPNNSWEELYASVPMSDERVLDPFAGSATTLVVAKKLGRDYLGFELSEEYVCRGNDRLSRARLGDELDGSPEPLVSAPSTPRGRIGSRARQLRLARRCHPQIEGRLPSPHRATIRPRLPQQYPGSKEDSSKPSAVSTTVTLSTEWSLIPRSMHNWPLNVGSWVCRAIREPGTGYCLTFVRPVSLSKCARRNARRLVGKIATIICSQARSRSLKC